MIKTAQDDSVRVLLMTGKEQLFSSGMDVRALANPEDPDTARMFHDTVPRMFNTVIDFPRLMGHQQAFWLLLSNEWVSTRRARKGWRRSRRNGRRISRSSRSGGHSLGSHPQNFPKQPAQATQRLSAIG